MKTCVAVQFGAEPRTAARIVASALGFGTLWGALLGTAVLVVLSLWGPVLLVFVPIAGIVGAILGGLDALLAAPLLIVVRRGVAGRRLHARLVTAGAAAVPPLLLTFGSLVDDGAGGWQWWLFVAALGAPTGAALGPRILIGRHR